MDTIEEDEDVSMLQEESEDDSEDEVTTYETYIFF